MFKSIVESNPCAEIKDQWKVQRFRPDGQFLSIEQRKRRSRLFRKESSEVVFAVGCSEFGDIGIRSSEINGVRSSELDGSSTENGKPEMRNPNEVDPTRRSSEFGVRNLRVRGERSEI